MHKYKVVAFKHQIEKLGMANIAPMLRTKKL